MKNKSKGWLDSYQEGGVESRMDGLTDKGFDYNGAWGGQFQKGGETDKACFDRNGYMIPCEKTSLSEPIEVTNPRDPRLNEYFDKTKYEKQYRDYWNFSKNAFKNKPIVNPSEYSNIYTDYFNRNPTFTDSPYLKKLPYHNKNLVTKIIGSKKEYDKNWATEGQWRDNAPLKVVNNRYSPSPTEIYTLAPQRITINRPQLPTQINVQERHVGAIPMPPRGPKTVGWNIEYFDPKQKKVVTQSFDSNEEAEQFYNSLPSGEKRKYSDVSSVGRMQLGGNVYPVDYIPQAQDGISFLNLPKEDPEMMYRDRFNTSLTKDEEKDFNSWVAKESKRRGRDIMMDKGAYDVQGFWKSGDYKKMDKDNHGLDTWKKPNHPTFSNQSKYHGVDGFYGGNWNPDGGYQPSKQTASLYGPSYYNQMFGEEPGRIEHLDPSRFRSGANSPSPLYYEMGGSLPGSVGFTYARTGSIPSNGKYGKKTLASAQNGMTFYQHGLDWKPKSMEQGGWLDQYVPEAQKGFVIPGVTDFKPASPATESTAIRMVNPSTKRVVSTATTGQKKKDVAVSSQDMRKANQRERDEEKQRVNERKSAVAARDQGKPFTLPSGETKKYEDMDWREKSYVAGKALEQRGRFNEDEETFFDEWINPLNLIGSTAAGLGEAPLEAREYDSNLPYIGAIANPLITGALGFDPLGSGIKTGKNIANKVGQSMESGVLSNTYKLNPSTKIVYQETKPLTKKDFWSDSEISEMISKKKNKSALYDEMYDEIEKLNLPDVQTPNELINLRPDYKKRLESFETVNFKNKFLTPEQQNLIRENQLGTEIDIRSILSNKSLDDYAKGKWIDPLLGSDIDLLKFAKEKDIFTNPFFGRNYYEGLMPKGQSSWYTSGSDIINFEKGKLNKYGGVIKDNNGYWNPDNWGKVVEIDSPDITMQGVNQPLLGISDEGDVQYMEPGQNYKFKGKKVTEFPIMQKKENGGWLNQYK